VADCSGAQRKSEVAGNGTDSNHAALLCASSALRVEMPADIDALAAASWTLRAWRASTRDALLAGTEQGFEVAASSATEERAATTCDARHLKSPRVAKRPATRIEAGVSKASKTLLWQICHKANLSNGWRQFAHSVRSCSLPALVEPSPDALFREWIHGCFEVTFSRPGA
jgi:hypothetical protein